MENRYLNQSFDWVTTTTNIYIFFDHEFDYKRVELWKDNSLSREIYHEIKDDENLQSTIDWYKNQSTLSQSESDFVRNMSKKAKEMKELFFSFNTNPNTKKYWDFIKENNAFDASDLKADGCGNYIIKLVVPHITLLEIHDGVKKTQDELETEEKKDYNNQKSSTNENEDEGMEM